MIDRGGQFGRRKGNRDATEDFGIDRYGRTSHAGFWVTDPEVTITGLSLKPLASMYAVSTSNLYFGFAGVPAPGACALLGIASVFASGRRRTGNQ